MTAIAIDRLPSGRVLLVVAGIYTTQSAIGSMTFQGVPAILRSAGAGLDLIGLVALFMLPWALKFLWAPAVERYRLPLRGRRRSRPIILAGQAVAVALVGLMAAFAPEEAPVLLFTMLGGVALVCATVDIACDGFAVEQLSERTRGWGNVMQVGGGYVGALLGGGLFLVLVGRVGWAPAVLAMTALILILTVPAALTPEPSGRVPSGPHRPSLADALGRAEIRRGLVVVLVFQLGLRIVQTLMAPFLIDRGFDLTLLGLMQGGVGTVFSLAGTVLAGAAVRSLGARAVLRGVAVLEALLFAALCVASLQPDVPRAVLLILIPACAGITGAAFVALYTAMMGWSSLRQAGVDFTLFQCADAAMAALAGFGGAMLAQHLGYRSGFGLAAVAALAAVGLLPVLLRRSDGSS